MNGDEYQSQGQLAGSSIFDSAAFSEATDYAISGPYYKLTVCQTEVTTAGYALDEEEVQDLI